MTNIENMDYELQQAGVDELDGFLNFPEIEEEEAPSEGLFLDSFWRESL